MHKPPVVILASVRWDFLWQRHQTLATLFAGAGYPTVFVETTGLANPLPTKDTLSKVFARVRRSGGAGEKPPAGKNLTVYAPLTAPPTYGAFRWSNAKLLVPRVLSDLRKIAGPHPVVVAHPPTRTTLGLISGLDPRLVLYDCSDDYEHFPGAPKDIGETERELFLRADLVSCTSEQLLKKARRVRPDAFLSGPAVDYERFAPLQDPHPDKGVSTVCFFGHVSLERIDFGAMRAIVGAGFELRIVGGLGSVEKGFFEEPGVDYRGEVPHALLPAALAGVDAFVLPYKVNGLTHSISPAKTYECLATGKPVVTAHLPAMQDLAGYLYLAQRPQDYVGVLRNLKHLETEEKRRARIELARKNSWDIRFLELEEALWRLL
ncbi:MAG: Glycosyltransferase [uncultured Rubrobacteraceae bacterium]|uniref:Glycosyltransferase n=1 Tax=uncultured Rubrobacteraceae bacterium TaxID=349277 RepID=A0A6J4QS57_9ACTN|nr:MAG: Glycosyltransferase [uncultured Rubrobacteraceae bacterium]